MRTAGFTNDMTGMYVMHDALRRELRLLGAVAARTDADPREVLRAAPGWELFKAVLHAHHGAEDDALWPGLRELIGDKPEVLAVLDAMDAEHAGIEPALAAVDAAIAATGPDEGALADAVARLSAGLNAHLDHEEDDGLPVVDAFATPEVLQRFGMEHAKRFGDTTSTVLPWLLEGASEADVETSLRPLPDPVRTAYAEQWKPAFQAQPRWGAPAS